MGIVNVIFLKITDPFNDKLRLLASIFIADEMPDTSLLGLLGGL